MYLSYSTSVCLQVKQTCLDSIFLISRKIRGAPNLDRLEVFVNFEISSSFCFLLLSRLCDFSCYFCSLVAMLCSMWYSLCSIYLVWVYSVCLTLCDFLFCVMFYESNVFPFVVCLVCEFCVIIRGFVYSACAVVVFCDFLTLFCFDHNSFVVPRYSLIFDSRVYFCRFVCSVLAILSFVFMLSYIFSFMFFSWGCAGMARRPHEMGSFCFWLQEYVLCYLLWP